MATPCWRRSDLPIDTEKPGFYDEKPGFYEKPGFLHPRTDEKPGFYEKPGFLQKGDEVRLLLEVVAPVEYRHRPAAKVR